MKMSFSEGNGIYIEHKLNNYVCNVFVNLMADYFH